MSRETKRGTVLVMAKAPVAGRVKTRLCPPLTLQQAATVAEAALVDTLTAVAACRAERRVVVLDGQPGAWLPAGFDVIAQGDGGLDERLEAAWRSIDGPAVQIGMDTPQVTPALLDGALETLAADDVTRRPRRAVLGLATDGGWWAVGFSAPRPGAFAGVPMSTAHTGRRQLARLRSLGLRVEPLPVLRDVDTYDDAVAVAALAPRTRTARAVAGLRLAAPAWAVPA